MFMTSRDMYVTSRELGWKQEQLMHASMSLTKKLSPDCGQQCRHRMHQLKYIDIFRSAS
jgi:hypothetical protein